MRQSFYILILLIVSSVGCSQENRFKKLIPAKPIGWVSDFEKVFTDEQVKILDSIIGEHEARTTNEIAIVTLALDSVTITSAEDFEQFTLELCKQWGIGKKEKDNGVAIIIIKNLKRIRIEVGYGLETKLTNAEAKIIIDSSIIPEFKRSDYFDGTLKVLLEIIKEIQ